MLKKDCAVKFKRKTSIMQTVYFAVSDGLQYKEEILESTDLKPGQLQAALYNLTFVGVIKRYLDSERKSFYIVQKQRLEAAPCLRGVNSIFNFKVNA